MVDTHQRRMIRRIAYFSLMEMAVVIAIMALLAGIVAGAVWKHFERAQVQAAKTQVKILKDAVITYKLDIKKLPTKLDDLVANPGGEKWNGPYLDGKKLPMDPWGNAYLYNLKGDGDFEIISYGADGQAGGTGKAEDVTSDE